ncbi:hypothetical protein [Pseudomonas syringae]|nr:hypothetical protein [Pseudomonas syringae]MDF7795911.1 hypothetical protein [Pseudomonas syringae]
MPSQKDELELEKLQASMSHDQVIKRMREDLEQLGNEVRNMPAHEPRNVLVSAASGAVFALVFSWLAFKVWF